MTIQSQSQQLAIPGGLVELYILDLTQLGGTVKYFTPTTGSTGGFVYWQGQAYTPLPIATNGWEYSSDGSQKKPQLSVSNVSKALLREIIELGDMVGGKLTRYRTFSNFLDNGAQADPTQFFPPDEFIIEQKVAHNNEQITWQLCSIIDRMGVKIPRRQVTKSGDSRYCTFPAVGAYRPSKY